MDITTKLGKAIQELEDLKKALAETDQKLNAFSQQKQRILDTGLTIQGRIQTLQELLADQEAEKKQDEKPAEAAPVAKASKKATTPLEVK